MLIGNDLDLKRWELEAELRRMGIPFTTDENDSLLRKRYKNALNEQWFNRALKGKVIRRKKDLSRPKSAESVYSSNPR